MEATASLPLLVLPADGLADEATVRAAATEAVAAFKRVSAAGLVAGASDRHLVTQAQRYLAEGAA